MDVEDDDDEELEVEEETTEDGELIEDSSTRSKAFRAFELNFGFTFDGTDEERVGGGLLLVVIAGDEFL